LEHYFDNNVQSNPVMEPLLVLCNLWVYIEGGGEPKYCRRGSFCSQTSMGANWGRRYIGFHCL